MNMYRPSTSAPHTVPPSEAGNVRQTNYPTYLSPAPPAPGTPHDVPNNQQHAGPGPDGLGLVMNQFSALSLPPLGPMPQGPNMPQIQTHHHTFAPGQEQPVAYQSYHVPVHVGMAPETTYPFNLPGQYPMQGGFPVPVPYHHGIPYTPGRAVTYAERHAERFMDRSSASDVPALENRRGSYSTNESTPATPFFSTASERAVSARATAVQSNYTTPSPEHIAVPAQAPKPQPVDEELLALLKENPAIPNAVPAVFTPPTHIKSIEQCLENRIAGNRNVYIRGLHPTTDDELLLHYASRFGKVEQSKAIIDTATGACKGFGFAKFADVHDSEKCIRGFYQLGYEVGFARESFNARLKAEGDESSTNLYLSNLPKAIDESELNAIFMNYHVVSSKILRDSMGNSRGVGFARFETRDECEDIIKKFHGASIGEEGLMMQVRFADTPTQKKLKRAVEYRQYLAEKNPGQMLTGQVRYADTPAQKELKRITAERRQFRTNEYNIGAYGTADVGIHPSIYQQGSWNRRAASSVNSSFAPRIFNRPPVAFPALPAMVPPAPAGHTSKQPSANNPRVGSSDGDSADGGAAITEAPVVANGSTQSSPVVKVTPPKGENMKPKL